MILVVQKLQSNATEEINLMEPQETVFEALCSSGEKHVVYYLIRPPKSNL